MSSTRVLGVRVDCVDMQAVLRRIDAMIESGGTHLVATLNAEFVMRARRDADFARILEMSELCIPDGAGVVWAARRNGCQVESAVAGADLVPQVAAACRDHQRSLFLLGAGPGVAEAAASRLRTTYPGLKVAAHAGSPDPADDAESLAKIGAARPSVLLVAYGAPNQEKWIDRLRDRLNVPVCIGVGGTLDYLAGAVPRAPAFMRRIGLEWLFRLFVQPWRIGRMAVLPVYAIEVMLSRR